jgi:hypothetical protein
VSEHAPDRSGLPAPPSSAELWKLDHPAGPLVASGTQLQPGQRVLVSVRPERVELRATAPTAPHERNAYQVRVRARVFLGELVEYEVSDGTTTWLVRGSHKDGPAPGEKAVIIAAPEDCRILPHQPAQQ